MAYYLKSFLKKKRQETPTFIQDRAVHELMHIQNPNLPSTQSESSAPHEFINHIEPTHSHEELARHDRTEEPRITPEQGDNDRRTEKGKARQYRWKIVIGLFLTFTVYALDLTITAPAVPFIASDFGKLSQLNWIISAFNLCNAAFIPFWGQIADIFGRYVAIQAASITTLIGTALFSGAPVTAFPVFLLGRGIQGAGCAGILIITRIILADKVSLKENARNNTTFTIVAGIGFGFGPVVGGILTQTNWRWCFMVSLPINAAGMVLTHFLLRTELVGPQKIILTNGNNTIECSQSFASKLSTIDFGGQLFFLFGMGLLVLSLTWAGSYYEWNNVKVLAPLILGILLIALFLIWEHLLIHGNMLAARFPLQKPMVSIPLIGSRNSGLLMYINFTTGMAIGAVFYFANLYFVLVQGLPASDSGRKLIWYMPGLGVGACVAIFACNVWPLRTWYPLFLGTLIEPFGVTLLAVAMNQAHKPLIFGMLALTGVGGGIRFMPGTLHGIGYRRKSISSIITLMELSVTLGGTFSSTLMLNIFNHHLSQHSLSFSSHSAQSLKELASLPAAQQAFFKSTAKAGILLAFYALTAFLWLGLVAMAALGNVKIGQEKAGDGQSSEDVLTEGSFVASWFRGPKEMARL